MKVVSYTDPLRFLIHYVLIRLWNQSYDELQHCVTAAFEIKLSNFFTIFNFLLLLFSFQIQRNTTPMYRAPEMVDLYSNMPVTEKADIWVSLLRYILFFGVASCYCFQFLNALRHADFAYIKPLQEGMAKKHQCVIFKLWLFDPCHLVWYQIFVFLFPTDTVPKI